MAICEFHFRAGGALGRMTSALAIVPEDGAGPFPVWYLLHGLSDDHTAWLRWTSLERYVSGLPLIVVMPDGGRGYYSDSHADPQAAHETQIVRDLTGFIDGRFRTVPGPEGRVVSGLSMGGYGALKLALKHPRLFGAAVSHSGALQAATTGYDEPSEWNDEKRRIFGDRPAGGPEDLFALAEELAPARVPALRIDCGTEDFLLDANRAFHARLTELRIQHEYEEFPGAHDWAYWDLHVRDAIAFFARFMRLPPVPPK